MAEKTPNESMLMFPSHENTLESLRYAKEDLAEAYCKLSKRYAYLSEKYRGLAKHEADDARTLELEAEIRRLAAESKGK